VAGGEKKRRNKSRGLREMILRHPSLLCDFRDNFKYDVKNNANINCNGGGQECPPHTYFPHN
jgi:hypothetical protein